MSSRLSNGRGRRLPRAAASPVAAVLLSALLSGCGGSSSKASGDGPAAAPPEPTVATIALPPDQPQRAACGLLTQAEVEAAIGAKVGPGKENAQQGRSLCVYSLASAPDQSVAVVSTTSSGVPAAFDAAREKAGGAQSVSVGDQAYVAGPQALVRKGTTMVAILVTLRQQPAQLSSMATKLAQAVGTHL